MISTVCLHPIVFITACNILMFCIQKEIGCFDSHLTHCGSWVCHGVSKDQLWTFRKFSYGIFHAVKKAWNLHYRKFIQVNYSMSKHLICVCVWSHVSIMYCMYQYCFLSLYFEAFFLLIFSEFLVYPVARHSSLKRDIRGNQEIWNYHQNLTSWQILREDACLSNKSMCSTDGEWTIEPRGKRDQYQEDLWEKWWMAESAYPWQWST